MSFVVLAPDVAIGLAAFLLAAIFFTGFEANIDTAVRSCPALIFSALLTVAFPVIKSTHTKYLSDSLQFM